MNWIDRILMRLIPHFVITGSDGSPYLVRYHLLWTPWFRVKLHHILRSDEDRELHDHPWNFTSILLWEGYHEVNSIPGHVGLPDWPRRHRAGTVIRHKATDAHRLILDAPAWTLVFVGGKKRVWGFHTDRGWVDFKTYLNQKYGPDNYETE